MKEKIRKIVGEIIEFCKIKEPLAETAYLMVFLMVGVCILVGLRYSGEIVAGSKFNSFVWMSLLTINSFLAIYLITEKFSGGLALGAIFFLGGFGLGGAYNLELFTIFSNMAISIIALSICTTILHASLKKLIEKNEKAKEKENHLQALRRGNQHKEGQMV